LPAAGNKHTDNYCLILSETLALYKSFTYLLTDLLTTTKYNYYSHSTTTTITTATASTPTTARSSQI